MGNISTIDLVVIATLMAGVTWLGHRLGGSISKRSEFFNAGGGLPWWAVSSSIIATVVSSVTFISVPAAVFKDGGDLTYIQVIIGLMLGKLITAALFAEPYYKSTSVKTTYDYIGQRIDPKVGNFSMWIGLCLSLINTAVKLLTTALVLSVMTDWSLGTCSLCIIFFSVLWSWLAGIKTVIWTDFLLFIIFAFGAVFSVIWTVSILDMSLSQALVLLDSNAKTALFDTSVDPHITYTIWAGMLGAITLSLALASSQGTMQRVRSCASVKEAKKAYNYAALFYLMHFCILGVGLAIWLFYQSVDLPLDVVKELQSQPDRIFPYFIMTEIPDGISGILIASIFAAGISTLDSALTEVSDISINNIYEPYITPNASERHYLLASKLSLIIWAVLFHAVAMFFSQFQAEGLLDLTFKLPNYLFGSLFGVIILARFRIGDFASFFAGFLVSMWAVWYMQSINIGFFWWCPVSGLSMIMTSLLISYVRGSLSPEYTGIVER